MGKSLRAKHFHSPKESVCACGKVNIRLMDSTPQFEFHFRSPPPFALCFPIFPLLFLLLQHFPLNKFARRLRQHFPADKQFLPNFHGTHSLPHLLLLFRLARKEKPAASGKHLQRNFSHCLKRRKIA